MIAKLEEKTNTPEFEEMQVTWDRAQSWLSQLGNSTNELVVKKITAIAEA